MSKREAAVSVAEAEEQKMVSAEPKPKAKAVRRPVMYVGPTVHGIGIQNQVLSEIPVSAKEKIKAVPEIGNLFIAIKDYPEANVMIREKRGYIYSAFKKALNIKNGGKK